MKSLVLEGGGMRSCFTAGVLDCFIDYGVRYNRVIGTSAGATCGLSYIARQKGRTRFSNIDLLKIYNYTGLNPLLHGRGIMDLDFLFYEYPDKYYPFDFETYREQPEQLTMVATSAVTGKAVYIEEKENFDRFLSACRSSCSLPVACKMGCVDGELMVDGGVADSIPFAHLIEEGALENGGEMLVVLTKTKEYRKKPGGIRLPWFVYKKFPKLREALMRRNDVYNAQLDELNRLESMGQVEVLRPLESMGVGRTSNNIENLEKLYDHGYRVALDYLQHKQKL